MAGSPCTEFGEFPVTGELAKVQWLVKRFAMRGILTAMESKALLNLALTAAVANDSRVRARADFGGGPPLCIICQHPIPAHGTVCAGGPEPEMCPMAQFIK